VTPVAVNGIGKSRTAKHCEDKNGNYDFQDVVDHDAPLHTYAHDVGYCQSTLVSSRYMTL